MHKGSGGYNASAIVFSQTSALPIETIFSLPNLRLSLNLNIRSFTSVSRAMSSANKSTVAEIRLGVRGTVILSMSPSPTYSTIFHCCRCCRPSCIRSYSSANCRPGPPYYKQHKSNILTDALSVNGGCRDNDACRLSCPLIIGGLQLVALQRGRVALRASQGSCIRTSCRVRRVIDPPPTDSLDSRPSSISDWDGPSCLPVHRLSVTSLRYLPCLPSCIVVLSSSDADHLSQSSALVISTSHLLVFLSATRR